MDNKIMGKQSKLVEKKRIPIEEIDYEKGQVL